MRKGIPKIDEVLNSRFDPAGGILAPNLVEDVANFEFLAVVDHPIICREWHLENLAEAPDDLNPDLLDQEQEYWGLSSTETLLQVRVSPSQLENC